MAPVFYNASTRVLHMAFSGEVDYRVLLAIEHILECRAEPCIANATAVHELLSGMEEEGLGADQIFGHVGKGDEMTRIISSYASTPGAERVRLAACGEYMWVRIEGKNSVNLLFGQQKKEIFSTSMRRPLKLSAAAGL